MPQINIRRELSLNISSPPAGWDALWIENGGVPYLRNSAGVDRALGIVGAGAGTENVVPKFNASGQLVDSDITDDGTQVQIASAKTVITTDGTGPHIRVEGTDIEITSDGGVGDAAYLSMTPTACDFGNYANSALSTITCGTTDPLQLGLDHNTNSIEYGIGTFGKNHEFGYVDDVFNMYSQYITLHAQTASRALYVDANKMIQSSATTSTELGHLSGVTSAVQTQLNAKALFTEVLYGFQTGGASFNPVDSTTYYTGIGAIAPTTTASAHDHSEDMDLTLDSVVAYVGNNSTAGSNENVTIQLRNVTAGTSHSIGVIRTNGGSTTNVGTFNFSSIGVLIPAGDSFCMQIDCPAWATNPLATVIRFKLKFRRA